MRYSLNPTNNTLLINFRVSFYADVLLISTDGAYKSAPNVQKKKFRQCVSIPTELPFLHATISGWVQVPLGLFGRRDELHKISQHLFFFSLSFFQREEFFPPYLPPSCQICWCQKHRFFMQFEKKKFQNSSPLCGFVCHLLEMPLKDLSCHRCSSSPPGDEEVEEEDISP